MRRPVVLALNPSIDAEWRVDGVRCEEKNNVLAEHRWAGGKGVNVARWLTHLGANPLLMLPLGGVSGEELAAGLRARKIASKIIPIREATRINVIITTPKQGQLRFNPLGPKLSAAERQRVLSASRAALRRASCLILSGSLPRGLPVGTYATLIRLAQASGVPVLLDCDGPALNAAVRARPFLVKPNEHELLAWFRNSGLRPGKATAISKGNFCCEPWELLARPPATLFPLDGERVRCVSEITFGKHSNKAVGPLFRLSGVTEEVQVAARQLSLATRGWVLVSRGSDPGLLVNALANVAITARPPRVKPRTTVGAGDALLAAVAHQIINGTPPQDWLRVGLATGSAATQLPAGQLPHP